MISDLSASRIRTADKCGLAYEYQYVKKLPAPYDKGATVFGNVIHDGLELWYGPDADPATSATQHQDLSLVDIVADGWWKVLPQEVAPPLRACIRSAIELDALASAIVISRPQIKSPRTTRDYLSSNEYARFEDCRDQLLRASDKCETMKWPKDENAFQAYRKSLVIAEQLQRRWRRLPRPMVVERGFDLEFAGVHIRGRIDQIRIDPDPQGEAKVEGLDVKTGRQMMTQMEAFIQAFLYDEACRQLPDLPVPDYWTFWMARHDKPQHGVIDYTRHAKLAERIIHGVRERIERQDFAPHYGMWCKSCDFKDLCEQEVGLWPAGENSMVLEMAS